MPVLFPSFTRRSEGLRISRKHVALKIADLNGNRKADLVFEDATGHYAAWLMDDTHILQGGTIGTADTAFHVV